MKFVKALKKFINLNNKAIQSADLDNIKAHALINDGNRLEEQGKLDEALNLYQQCTERFPSTPRGFLNRGTLLGSMGQFEEGLAYLNKAIEIQHDYVGAYFNRGNLFQDMSQIDKAIESYLAALHFDSGFVAAHNNLGLAYLTQQRYDDAVASFSNATAINPKVVDATFNLGKAMLARGETGSLVTKCRDLVKLSPESLEASLALADALQIEGEVEEAIAEYEKIQIKFPASPDAFRNLGDLLSERGQSEPALKNYQHVLRLDSHSVDAYIKTGTVLYELKRFDESILMFQAGIRLPSFNAELFNGMGNAYRDLGKYEKAISAYKEAISINQHHAGAHGNLANTLRDIRDYEASSLSHLRALELNPAMASGYSNYACTLMDLGKYEDAIINCEKALELNPDLTPALVNLGVAQKECGQLENALRTISRAIERDPENLNAWDCKLFVQHLVSNETGQQKLDLAKQYNEIIEKSAVKYNNWACEKNAVRKLKIGFVSGDFRNHPVGFFIEGVIKEINKQCGDEIEMHAYYSDVRVDYITNSIRSCCAGWRSIVGIPDQQVASRIHEDQIDILIDLAGHTHLNRLPVFAWKSAPVQVSWLGYFATTGVREIDYLIADAHTLPLDQERYFVEKIWRLPETRLCFTTPTASPDVGALPAVSNGFVTFGCFNNLNKINRQVIKTWATIMAGVPKSQIFLKSKQLQDNSIANNIIKAFADEGIDSNRVRLEGQSHRSEYLAKYGEVDIALDPFPYTGGTTTVESLWMGVPVVTLAGENFLSRQGVGLLANAGLPDWIATDEGSYIATAIKHASDQALLAALRETLRQQVLNSPIYDAPRFAKHLAAAMRGMWCEWIDE